MYAIGFLVGCWGLMQSSILPSFGLLLLIAFVFFFLAIVFRDWKIGVAYFEKLRGHTILLFLGCCFLGLFWQAWHAQGLLGKRLSSELEGKNLIIRGVVSDLPQCDSQHCSFNFWVESVVGEKSFRQSTVHLSWYGDLKPLHVGERWQFAVRLKRPRSTLNPGAFDAEAWSWQHHLSARGSVSQRGQNRYLGKARGYWLPRIREHLIEASREQLKNQPLGGVITALSLGWTQDISSDQRLVVQRTGTAHLLAISGLHVGMVAGLFAWLIRYLWAFLPRIPLVLAAPSMAALGGIIAALLYSEMAGFACSTQRASVMCVLLFLPKILHRHITVKTAFFRALWLVLIWDPCVVMSSGFWLSFSAVFVLIFAHASKDLPRWAQHLETQWICLIGLLPLSCWYFNQVSVVSFLANLIAIPLVGFVVLPLVLLGTAFVIPKAVWAKVVFLFAIKIIMILGTGLDWLSHQSWAVWTYNFNHSWEFLSVSFGCALIVFGHSYWRWFGLLGVLPLILPSQSGLQKGQIKLTVLDVGQGLATIISTAEHNLIFDTGPKFSAQMDSGQQIVIPYLIREKIRSVSTLIVSHGDNDHAGGAQAILQQLPVQKFYTSSVEQFKIEHFHSLNKSTMPVPVLCEAGQSWQWDGVKFEFLHPPPPSVSEEFSKTNNRSCVLKVSSEYGAIFLAGDIEKKAEQWLCEQLPEKLKSTILIVPHHGSKTSSTAEFIAATDPEVAIFSYGYRNRYHHPNSTVLKRYREQGVDIYDTVSTGAINYTLGSNLVWDFYRQHHREFWRTSL